MDIQTATVVGTARGDAWSQVQTFPDPDGQTILLLSLIYTGESELVDLASIGAGLLESFGHSRTLSPDLLDFDVKEIVPSILSIHFNGESLSVTGLGKTELYILRDAQFGKLFGGTQTLTTISGSVQSGDSLLLATSETIQTLGLAMTKHLMETGIMAGEDLAVQVHGKQDSSRMAAAIIRIRTAPQHVVTPPPAPSHRTQILSTLISKLSWQRPLFIAPEKRKKNLWIGTALLFLLTIGIIVGAIRRSSLLKEQALTSLNHGVAQRLQEARSVGDLNPERAKILLKQSHDEITRYLDKAPNETYAAKARSLEDDLTTAETEIFKKARVTLTTLAEISVIKKDLQPTAFASDENGVLYLADGSTQRIVGISTTDKSVFEYLTYDVGKTGEMGIYKKKVYALASDGVAQITQNNASTVIHPDDLWKDVQMLDVFAGNVYLLDKGQSEIWKYPALTEGFGTRKRWLAPGIEPDLSNVIDMKVDGDVWVITTSGKLIRYSRGVPVSFSMEGLPSDGSLLKDPKAIVATGEKVYVLERGEQRVVVFGEESGKYERQYASDELEKAKDMAVYEGKVYVLFDDKIAWFQL